METVQHRPAASVADELAARHNQPSKAGVVDSVGVLIARAMPPIAAMGTEQDASEARAFTDSAEPHLPKMLHLARRLAGQNAEDVVQEALARAWAKRHQYDPARGTFGAWLLAITAERAYKAWRWGRRHNAPVVVRPDPPSAFEAIDLERSLDRLPTRQRLAVDCYYFAGLSVAETALVMHCSEGNVKSTLSAARRTLRDLLR